MRKSILAVLATLAITLGLVSTATAAPTASVAQSGNRLVVTISGKQPSKATLKVAGASFKLSRSGKTWRTKALSTAQLSAVAGQAARVVMKSKGKKRTAKTTVPGGSTTPDNGSTPPAPPSGGGAAPLFTAPGVDSTGTAAWDAVKGYFSNSTLTDCPAGWPNCSVEERYGIFENGTQWYCRLTPTAQSDIRSVSNIVKVIGAEQKADGSWGVSYQVNSYDNLHQYTVRVAANGAAVVQWWGSGADFSGPPNEVKSGLVWMRGAKDCSY